MCSPEVLHVAEKRDSLQRFAETHLVGQDSVDSVLVERDHPVQATDLVVPHLTALIKYRNLRLTLF